MKTFLQPLQNLAEMEEIQKQAKKNRGILEISGCMESQKAHFMYGLSGLFPCHLVIAADEKSAKELYEDYRFYDKRVYYYPAKDLLFFQADIHGNLLIRQRMQVIRALLEREDEITVVTSIDGCMDYLAPLEKALVRLEKELAKKAEEFDDVITMGRTQLQDAVPIRLGQVFHGYASMVSRDRKRIEKAHREMYTVNLGGTAVGTAINVSDSYFYAFITFITSIRQEDKQQNV